MKEPNDQIAPARIVAEVLNEVRSELNLYEDNAEDGTTKRTRPLLELKNSIDELPSEPDFE